MHSFLPLVERYEALSWHEARRLLTASTRAHVLIAMLFTPTRHLTTENGGAYFHFNIVCSRETPRHPLMIRNYSTAVSPHTRRTYFSFISFRRASPGPYEQLLYGIVPFEQPAVLFRANKKRYWGLRRSVSRAIGSGNEQRP